jgi:outer membrane protein assembly factor BamB
MSPENPHRGRRIVIGVAALIVVLIAAGAVYALTRGGDVSNPGVEFHAEPTQTPVPDTAATPSHHGRRKDPLASFVWGDYGYTKDRRHYLPASFDIRPPFRHLWQHNDPVLLEFPPILVGPRFYQLDNTGYAMALNKANGHLIWRHRVGTLAAGSPAWGGGLIYMTLLTRAGSAGGRVVALHPKNGHVAWSRDLPARSESSPVFDGGHVFFGSEDGIVYALDAKNGHTAWTFHAGGAVKAALALSAGKLYFGDYGGKVYALHEGNGHIAWQTTTHGTHFGFGSGNFYSTPAVAFGRVYIGNTDGSMYSFAADSGRLAWSTGTSSYVYSSPAVAQVPGGQPTVYFGSYDGNFYALDARSGGHRWSFRSGGKISGAPTVVGNIVYFSDSGTHSTYGLNATTGSHVWTFDKGAFNPVISDGRTIFLTGHSSLFALRPYGIGKLAAPKPTTAREARKRRHHSKH